MIVPNGTISYQLLSEQTTDEQGRPTEAEPQWSEPISANVLVASEERQIHLQDGTTVHQRFVVLTEAEIPLSIALAQIALHCNNFGIRKVIAVEPLPYVSCTKITLA